MDVQLIGASFQTADLHTREALAKMLSSLSKKDLSFPFVTLITCNRAEIYFSPSEDEEVMDDLFSYFEQHIEKEKLYTKLGKETFLHLSTVTAGLKSALFMESDIQRQVKIAYQKACLERSLSSALHFLFQKAFHVAKAIRTNSDVKPFSLAQKIWELIKQEKDPNILFIGYSSTNQKIIHYLQKKGLHKGALFSRYYEAKEYAEKVGLTFLQESGSHFFSYDIIIAATNREEYLIEHQSYPQETMKSNIILDLSVPRSVAPSLAFFPRVKLLNIDEIERITLPQEEILEQKAKEYIDAAKCHVSRLISGYQNKTRSPKELELAL